MSQTTIITLRLDLDTLAAVDRLAVEREWTRSHWMRRAIERAVAGELSKKPA